jgi:hypothetical protein
MAHPHRTIYNTQTGRIVMCRKMSEAILSRQLTSEDNLAYINGCWDVNKYRINLDSLEAEQIPTVAVDYTDWMRDRRNKLLTASDWTQGADSPLSDAKKAEWQTYRISLRDLPNNYTDGISAKSDVVWPVKPS